jgi:hypothetical protein
MRPVQASAVVLGLPATVRAGGAQACRTAGAGGPHVWAPHANPDRGVERQPLARQPTPAKQGSIRALRGVLHVGQLMHGRRPHLGDASTGHRGTVEGKGLARAGHTAARQDQAVPRRLVLPCARMHGGRLPRREPWHAPLAEPWNGKTWRVQSISSPRAGIFNAVSCTSPTACTAAGTRLDTGGTTLAERWNGKRWRVERTPNRADFRRSFRAVALDDVSCTSAKACVASGDYSPHGAAAYFVAACDGARWRLQTARRFPPASRTALSWACRACRCGAPRSADTRVGAASR